MELILLRKYFPGGTNGELLLNGERVCHTIELPWKNNEGQVSCIPEGKYELKGRYSPRFGNHFILPNVPGRSNILIHAANDAFKEIKGCIASVSVLTGEGKGVQARKALARLIALVYPAFENKKPIFIIIQSINNEYSN